METELFDYFPRVHTAIAEWLVCVLYILPLQKRIKGVGLVVLMAAFFGLLLMTNIVGERVLGFLWILPMVFGMVLMLLMIYIICKLTLPEAGYYWAHAFIAAEFAASLEWQINYYLLNSGIVHIFQSTLYLHVRGVCTGVWVALHPEPADLP